MLQLNLPQYNFNVKKRGEKYVILDSQRKRYVALTPEEWVRQHFIRFLTEEKGYPPALLSVEHQLEVNGMKRRCDAVLFGRDAQAQLILEFKAPDIPVSQAVFDQVAVYNSKLKVDYFMLSNGMEHYACRIDLATAQYKFLPGIPDYSFFSAISV
ncbi:MAG: type I restriction enzyme HsdR N-terminal domain-containing protein [Prevotellaceae bacterium]|jgi:hypothetical protein|nr:type I restriction enzyme HsdR N-terminal domain-containing protein [Prevotellaceae bacterium]